ncbi:MAG: excinuclease ABC subunit UvrC [Balneolales bacterium]
MNENLTYKLDHLPFQPGVYLFKDTGNSILYIGKAKRLRNRVRSYFQESRPFSGKIQALVNRIADVEVITTDSEAEALILENNLIKQHQPRYNINLKDDKSYPYICVTNEDRPRVFPTRTIIRDGSRYFGPYDHAGKMRQMLETIRQTFGLCTCAVTPRMIDHSRGMPKWGKCFEDYFENCSEEMDAELYRDIVEKVKRLLNGKTDGLIRDLKEEMLMASQSMEYEKAAQLRDGINSLNKYSQKMKIITNDAIDRDVFGLEVDEEENLACGVLFKIRDGKLLGRYHRLLKNIEGRQNAEILQTFIEDYYTSAVAGTSPDEVHISDVLEDDEPLLEFLAEEHHKKVPIIQPKIGEKAQFVRMALSNAKLLLGEAKVQKQKAETDRIPHSVKCLQRDLRLKQPPRRIECFDISNLQGTDTVASLVCFVDGQPRKSEYKRYNINTVTGPDDFASMREVIRRRYSRLMKEKQHIPDMIIVDGGKGQLSSAVAVLKDIGFFGQATLIGLAKRLEEVYLPGESEPVMIPKTSSSLKLLQRLRDEAHRFAITFHRQKRSKRTFKSELQDIAGVGEKSVTKLLTHFGSARQVSEAERSQLEPIVGKAIAEKVYKSLREKALKSEK